MKASCTFRSLALNPLGPIRRAQLIKPIELQGLVLFVKLTGVIWAHLFRLSPTGWDLET